MIHRRLLMPLLGALLALPPLAFAEDAAISVKSGWARATPPGARSGGGYLTIENPGTSADRLISAASPAAETTEVHLMKTENGVMTMRPAADGVEIPAGASLVLQPGSYHLMFIRPKAPFVAGTHIPVTLRFEKAGEVSIELDVQPIGAKGPSAGHEMGGMNHEMKTEGTTP